MRLLLPQDVQSSGIKAQAIRRVRFALSEDVAWEQLVGEHAARRLEVKKLGDQLEAIQSVRVPVMAEQPSSQLRDTRVFLRGELADQRCAR